MTDRRYDIRYTRDGGTTYTLTSRKATDAVDAISRLCDQYGWEWHLDMIDADTHGNEWAQCSVDTYGGRNWNMTITAVENKID